jgi:carotenoid cleavage dioxygenase-like enzyme
VAADFPVPLPAPIMMHDMALTQKHVILLDTPLEFDPKVLGADVAGACWGVLGRAGVCWGVLGWAGLCCKRAC